MWTDSDGLWIRGAIRGFTFPPRRRDRGTGSGPILIEHGAGAGVKAELVLNALAKPQGYVPIDLAPEYLLQAVHRMERRFRSLWVRPVEREGESSLWGRVLPGGGIKEKVVAAAGLARVMLPDCNRRDYDDIPAGAREKL